MRRVLMRVNTRKALPLCTCIQDFLNARPGPRSSGWANTPPDPSAWTQDPPRVASSDCTPCTYMAVWPGPAPIPSSSLWMTQWWWAWSPVIMRRPIWRKLQTCHSDAKTTVLSWMSPKLRSWMWTLGGHNIRGLTHHWGLMVLLRRGWGASDTWEITL